MNHKDKIIADQQRALQTAERALAEARAQITSAQASLTRGQPEQASAILTDHLKQIGLA